jgi:hypothetical protein
VVDHDKRGPVETVAVDSYRSAASVHQVEGPVVQKPDGPAGLAEGLADLIVDPMTLSMFLGQTCSVAALDLNHHALASDDDQGITELPVAAGDPFRRGRENEVWESSRGCGVVGGFFSGRTATPPGVERGRGGDHPRVDAVGRFDDQCEPAGIRLLLSHIVARWSGRVAAVLRGRH